MLEFETVVYLIKVGILIICLIILIWLIIDSIINRPIKLFNSNKERDEFINALKDHNLYLAKRLDEEVDRLEKKEREAKEPETKKLLEKEEDKNSQ